ncbi:MULTISPECIES: hypothetical protein [unclassified Microcoleus]|uniref:hypothetical protein n=1 Tax=unclassified Microcoleus TaxID=2642155 RepID=UPI002FD59FC8
MFPKFSAIFTALLLCSCADTSPARAEESDPIEASEGNTGLVFHLEPRELSEQMALAQSGSNEAALRVADHYALSELSPEQSLPWLVMAAERGNVRAMQNLSYHYGSGMSPKTDCLQAAKWWDTALSQASESDLEKYGIRDQIAQFTGEQGSCSSLGPNYSLKRTNQSLRD